MSGHEPSTVSMKGGGYYSQHTRGAKDVIDATASLALEAVERLDLTATERCFQLADLGAADGGTSVDLVRAVIGAVRARAPERQVMVTYTDLPRNDFSALFAMVGGGREDVRSYLADHEQVYVFASGTSFYRQIFPDASLDLAFSATAMHWLSGSPGPISDHVHAVGARGAELEAYRAWAMRDWSSLLGHRARELVDGGRLVMANFCIDEQGRYLGNTGGINMFDTFDALWRQRVDDGVITPEEYERVAFPQFYKTVEEYCRPLQDTSSTAYRAGLRLESARTAVVECPYAAAYREHGDAARFAEAYVPTLRSWSETVFASALDPARPPEAHRSIVDDFYASYTQLVRAAPEGHAMDYVHVYMSAYKESSGGLMSM